MRKSTTMFVTLILFVVAISAQMQRKPAPPLIVKGAGERTPQASGPNPPPPPPGLSAAAKQQLLKSLNLPGPGSQYMKLTPRNTYAASRGSLQFNNADVVSGDMDYAVWFNALDNGTKYARVKIKSEGAGHHYLFDCSVGAASKVQDKGPFKLWRNQKMIQTFDADEPHLVFLLDAADDGWNTFQIFGGPHWYFYGCEITRL